MLKFALYLLFTFFGGLAGYGLTGFVYYRFNLVKHYPESYVTIAIILLGAGVGYLIGRGFIYLVENLIKRGTESDISDLLLGTAGLVIGLIIGNLIAYPLSLIPKIGGYLPIIFTVAMGIIGIEVALTRRNELYFKYQGGERGEEKERKIKFPLKKKKKYSSPPKILDSSVIIDGRIIDILKTGFVEGTIIIPKFILDEIHKLADSQEDLKRKRGKRGLEMIEKIKKEKISNIYIPDVDYRNIKDADDKLVKYALEIGGKIVTNDYNLNKVAQIQNVEVLNINELTNAVKTLVLPGEELIVKILKEGKEGDQGIGYLEDGTMIVVENGKKYIGYEVKIEVTSSIQTSAGKMIFGKVKEVLSSEKG